MMGACEVGRPLRDQWQTRRGAIRFRHQRLHGDFVHLSVDGLVRMRPRVYG